MSAGRVADVEPPAGIEVQFHARDRLGGEHAPREEGGNKQRAEHGIRGLGR